MLAVKRVRLFAAAGGAPAFEVRDAGHATAPARTGRRDSRPAAPQPCGRRHQEREPGYWAQFLERVNDLGTGIGRDFLVSVAA